MLKLAWTNLVRRRRSIVMTVIVTAVAVLAVVLAAALGVYINSGMELSKERLGADVLIYPLESQADITQLLYSGIPEMVYMDADLIDGAVPMEDVEVISPQFFLQTLPDGGCCATDDVLRIVGIDPETDFVISPWYDVSQLDEETMLQGSHGVFKPGLNTMILGGFFTMGDKLPATGSSIDHSVYVDIDTARELAVQRFSQDDQQLWAVDADLSNQVTCFLIKLKDGVDAEAFAAEVKKNVPIVNVATVSSASEQLTHQMGDLTKILFAFAVISIVLACMALYAQFYNIINKRQREIGYFRSIGLRRKDIFTMIGAEVAFMGGIGGIIGGVAAVALLDPVIHFLQELLVVPTGAWGIGNTVLWVVIGIVFSLVICFASALYPAYRSVGMEPAKAISEGEI